MPSARLARLTAALAVFFGAALPAGADVGGTLSLQTDARSRGMSYSGNRPSAQVSLAWDGDGGWYGGGQLGYARFDAQHRGGWLQVYGGRVFGLAPGLDGEAGVVAHVFESVSRYDYQEAYCGLLGDGWQLRVYASPDYYGVGQRSLYAELNARWPLDSGWSAVGHVGVLRGFGSQVVPYSSLPGSTRQDLRLGASRLLGTGSELQLAWVAASRGDPYTWTDSSRRRTLQLTLTTAF
ncbi:TorF family putative porin [Roseateles sp. BYS78W]|uniref:TorF family putative porin n=1 Tax=Pelomonas candidula TaxID=3299025 RepID=A0ABW7HKR8_9BURK